MNNLGELFKSAVVAYSELSHGDLFKYGNLLCMKTDNQDLEDHDSYGHPYYYVVISSPNPDEVGRAYTLAATAPVEQVEIDTPAVFKFKEKV